MPPFDLFQEILPFSLHLDATAIAGTALWSLALYLGFSPATDWVTEQLGRWLNFAERSLYFSEEDFEETRPVRESVNALYASVLSIIPFLALGVGFNYGVEIGLGRSWAISMGILACISCAVYELGRRDGQTRS
ncbi:MAG: hypothetical protein ACO31I_18505 [Prochlorotrichaceae cyanobacterium]|jgi:hypothetical protein